MAFVNDNRAYDFSLFEDGNSSAARKLQRIPRKPENKVVKMPKRKIEQKKRRKYNTAKLVTGFAFSAIVVAVLAIIIYGQAQLTELNQQIKDAQETLSNSQSTYTQMQMNVDAKYTPSIIDDYAKNQLGMSKATNGQKVFIELSDGDKAQVITDTEKTLFDKIADAIASLWS